MVWDMNWNLFFCIWISNCSSIIHWKVSPFSIELPLSKINWSSIWCQFLNPLFCSVDLHVCIKSIHHYLDDHSFIVSLGVKNWPSLTLLFFFKVILFILRPLHFCMNFRRSLTISTKKTKKQNSSWDSF